MKKEFKAVRPRFADDKYLLQDAMIVTLKANQFEPRRMHWRQAYKTCADDVLRYIWLSPSTFPKDRRDCARAIVAGRAAAKKSKASRKRGLGAVVHLRIAESLDLDISDACVNLGMTKSDFVRMAIENEVNEIEWGQFDD